MGESTAQIQSLTNFVLVGSKLGLNTTAGCHGVRISAAGPAEQPLVNVTVITQT